MKRRASFARIGTALMVATCLAVSMIAAGVTAEPASAADARGFKAGAIVSDGAFYNSSSMSVDDIQSFLREKRPTCRSGYTCLKDYRQTTWTRGADPMCSGYEGRGNESSAEIIKKVAVSCGISPKTLLVLLEKEQSLVTDDWPSQNQYNKATGYACPDTAPCDAQYFGFYNQVFMAAWAFKRYAMPPGTGPGTQWTTRFDQMYPVARTSAIQIHPDRGCGTRDVYIENQATHALYVYTPYTPSQDALNAGWGSIGSCGAYGNRNFYLFFTDWFGSTGYSVNGAIGDYYRSIGGANSVVGEPIGDMQTVAGGWRQNFQRGVLFAEDGRPVRLVKGAILGRHDALGGQSGVLGWPRGDEQAVAGGWIQDFAGGGVYSSASGTWDVRGAIVGAYRASGAQTGAYGWPRGSEVGGADGWSQEFSGATLTWTASGAIRVEGAVRDAYSTAGGAAGYLGVPVQAMAARAEGWSQLFTRGVVAVPRSGDTVLVKGAIGDFYRASGSVGGALGWPQTREQTLTGGWVQDFSSGRIFSSASGTWSTTGQIRAEHDRLGAQRSPVGWPSGAPVAQAGGVAQDFSMGALAVRNGASYVVKGAIGEAYVAAGGVRGSVGLPIGQESGGAGTWRQSFDAGEIVCSANGTFVVPAALAAEYRVNVAAIGSPVGAARIDGQTVVQTFERGTLVADGGTARVVKGEIGRQWTESGGLSGVLGAPTGSETAIQGGWYQRFDDGLIVVQAGRSAVTVLDPQGAEYVRLGGPTGALSWPQGGVSTSADVQRQDFNGGVIVTSGAGTFASQGSIGSVYRSIGADRSDVGAPVSGERTVDGGWMQNFRAGVIGASSRGTFVVKGAIGAEYVRLGADRSGLGLPIGSEAGTATGWEQRFQNGTIAVGRDGSVVVRQQ